MAKQRAHKAAAAAERAKKDSQFKAYQKELGLLSDKDGEDLALGTPQKAAAGTQWCKLPSNVMGGHQGNVLPRWIQTPLPLSQHPLSPLTC